MTDEELIYGCALRYSLGRRTYITSVVSNFLAGKADELSAKCKNNMIRDIKEAKKEHGLGDRCDYISWMKLLDKLEGGEKTGKKAKTQGTQEAQEAEATD